MSVDLADLVEPLQIEVQAPGGDAYADATEDDYLGTLINSFWEIRLYGYLGGFEEDSASRGGHPEFTVGIVTPLGVDPTYDDPFGYSTTQDLSRDLQQLIILWAAWKIALNNMATVNSVFRAKAGPVEYETQQAASVLTAVLDALKARITYLIANLPTSYGGRGGAVVLDAIIERSYSQAVGETWWVRG
jgi:hypothetical protein